MNTEARAWCIDVLVPTFKPHASAWYCLLHTLRSNEKQFSAELKGCSFWEALEEWYGREKSVDPLPTIEIVKTIPYSFIEVAIEVSGVELCEADKWFTVVASSIRVFLRDAMAINYLQHLILRLQLLEALLESRVLKAAFEKSNRQLGHKYTSLLPGVLIINRQNIVV